LLLKKVDASRGSKVCSLLSLVLNPKRVHVTSLTLAAEYGGSGWHIAPNKTIINT
jgi:hypothetical protein